MEKKEKQTTNKNKQAKTHDTPSEAVRYLLELPTMTTRHKEEQVRAYLNAMQNSKNPHHDAVKKVGGCGLARGKPWMGQVQQSIQHVCGLTEPKQVRDWKKKLPNEFKPYNETMPPGNQGTYWHELPAGKKCT